MNIKLQYVAILMAIFVSTLHCRPKQACDIVKTLPEKTDYADIITCRIHNLNPELSYEEVAAIVDKHFMAIWEEINSLKSKKQK